jgi:hypothetical protein
MQHQRHFMPAAMMGGRGMGRQLVQAPRPVKRHERAATTRLQSSEPESERERISLRTTNQITGTAVHANPRIWSPDHLINRTTRPNGTPPGPQTVQSPDRVLREVAHWDQSETFAGDNVTLFSGLSSRVLMAKVRLIRGRGSAAFHKELVL